MTVVSESTPMRCLSEERARIAEYIEQDERARARSVESIANADGRLARYRESIQAIDVAIEQLGGAA